MTRAPLLLLSAAAILLILLLPSFAESKDLALPPPIEGSTCELPKLLAGSPGSYCHYIEKHCDPEYFAISKYYFCSRYVGSTSLLLAVSLAIIVTLVVILLSLTILVANYLFKNLNDVTVNLNINNQILGFILVPLSNTFPDMINYYVALNSGSSDLVIGQLVGSILILFTVVIGLISVFNSPFEVVHKKVLAIDFAWVLLVLVIFLYILLDGRITIVECAFMALAYLVYIAFLCLFNKEKMSEDQECQNLLSHQAHPNHLSEYLEVPYNIEDALSILSNEEVSYGAISPSKSPSSLVETEDLEQQSDGDIQLIVPQFHRDQLSEEALSISKFFVNVIDMIFFILIPIHLTERDLDELHWKHKINEYKALHYWFLIEIPLLFNYQFFHFAWTTLISIILVEFLLVELAYDHVPPKFRSIIISIAGVANTLIITSEFSMKILEILKNFGLIWHISDYLLGLLVFSISNSINDLVTNLTISTKINPILGINACLGTPMLIILLGIGVNGIIVLLKHGQTAIKFSLTDNVVISMTSLLLIVAFYFVYIPLNNWQFDKRGGLILIAWYAMTTGVNCYLEM